MTTKMAASVELLKWCQTMFLLIIAVASLKGVTSSSLNLQEAVCGVNTGYFKTDTLVQPRSWLLNYTQSGQTQTQCVGGNATGCQFSLAFCHAINCSDTDPSLMNATACISTATPGNKTTTYKLGSFNANQNPFKEDPKGKGLSFLVQFSNGSDYNTSAGKPCNLTMELQFKCNEKSLWYVSAGAKQSNISSTVLNNLTYDPLHCKYILAFNYSGACPTVIPYPDHPTVEPISIGSVLLIIFIVLLSVYCVFGSMCKFAAGARGAEALPHNEFWVELPAYIADGFVFVCRCCRPVDPASKSYDSI